MRLSHFGDRHDRAEPAEQETTALTVQVLWGCRVYNTTPGETPQRVVADLFEQLSQGGTVTVHIEDADGKEHTLDASV
ncbi:MAG: hypothetical protein WCA27_18325 [Candidatus Sulfotelmatobacter sp.]